MGDSYIGSKLSLISKSDIRYVGILQNVDTPSSSLVLGQVQSFGTEGRRGGGAQDEIPPSSVIFECIVFRGTDVKDLQVFEAPPITMTSDDITRYASPVSSVSPVPPAFSAYSNNYPIPVISPYGAPVTYYSTVTSYMPPDTHFARPINTTLTMMTQKHQVPDDIILGSRVSSETLIPEHKTQTPLLPFVDGKKHLMISKPDTKDSPIPSSRTISDPLDAVSNRTKVNGLTRLVDDLDIGNMKGQSPTDKTDLSDKDSIIPSNDTKTRHNVDPHVNRRSKKTTSSSKHKSKPGKGKITAIQEFDFASSNAKFNKESEQVEVDSVNIFYDKDKSFFDNISCDAKERTDTIVNNRNHRTKHKDEKQLNLETFGRAYIHPRRKQGRRGGRTNSTRHNNGKRQQNRQRGDNNDEHPVL
ncbi:Scd6-like Sm domain-containing protein [Chlamydoabsidia padenii]|nr:Scd6-like Sm domain-containing protein [Chlamydoabsidia padenii]